MYFEMLRAENIRQGTESLVHDFRDGSGTIRKWTVCEATSRTDALLRCAGLAGLGRQQAALLDSRVLDELVEREDRPTSVEAVMIRHTPQERLPHSPVRRHCGWRWWRGGKVTPLARSTGHLSVAGASVQGVDTGRSHRGRLVVGYGHQVIAHEGTDRFDIYPDQRLRRWAGLFDNAARLTDPLAFLLRLHRKSGYRRGRAHGLLIRLSTDLTTWLGWDPTNLLSRPDALDQRWHALPTWQRAAAVVLLDLARHAYDAADQLGDPDPLRQPGVVLMAGADGWCPGPRLYQFLALLDARFPSVQFLVTLSRSALRRFPAGLLRGRLPVPQAESRPHLAPVRPLGRATTLLVDVDGVLPNVALMKLSRHLQNQGRRVALVRGVRSLPEAEAVMASCVFDTPPSARRVARLRHRYSDRLTLGGSGADLGVRLAPEIEALAADYSLYPELGDRAIGFLTRGCPMHCPFCIVPQKEGTPRRVGDLDALLQGRAKLILLDDNLLAHADGLALIEEMVRRKLQVNFNQTLDLRRLTREGAGLLRQLACANVSFSRRVYHFSLNEARGLESLRRRYAWLQTRPSDNVEFVCMYGFNTSLAEDVERFRFLRSLPGAYVFVQRYRPIPGAPPVDLRGFFDHRAEELMTELVRIVYRQNMKSLETYYRWLALEYAAQRGRIHQGLIETLFRYNKRSGMAGFLQRLDDICRQRSLDGAHG